MAEIKAVRKIEMVSIDKLVEYERNPRINDDAVDSVAASIEEFGFNNPILTDKNFRICAGHTRLKAARKLGIETVPVIRLDLTEQEFKAFNIADNKTAQIAQWDIPELSSLLRELQDEDFDLTLTGFNDEEIDELLESLNEPPDKHTEEELEEIPDPPEESDIKPGDIFLLGKHLLMCGDSTNKDDVAKLMDGKKADMIFTDPPYNVNYEGKGEDKLKYDDNFSEEEYAKLLFNVFTNAHIFSQEKASLYLCHGSCWQMMTEQILNKTGYNARTQIVWVKNNSTFGFGRYKFRHEPIFYCNKKSVSDNWYGDATQTTVWEFPKPTANKEHPTPKPVGLVMKAIENSCKANEIVLDFFGGSGSTLIACEESGRSARLMEIEPRFCDVIIRRWEKLTGKKAEKILENAA